MIWFLPPPSPPPRPQPRSDAPVSACPDLVTPDAFVCRRSCAETGRPRERGGGIRAGGAGLVAEEPATRRCGRGGQSGIAASTGQGGYRARQGSPFPDCRRAAGEACSTEPEPPRRRTTSNRPRQVTQAAASISAAPLLVFFRPLSTSRRRCRRRADAIGRALVLPRRIHHPVSRRATRPLRGDDKKAREYGCAPRIGRDRTAARRRGRACAAPRAAVVKTN